MRGTIKKNFLPAANYSADGYGYEVTLLPLLRLQLVEYLKKWYFCVSSASR